MCVFIDCTRVLCDSTGDFVVLRGFYGDLRPALCVFIDFTMVLGDSTGEFVILQNFYRALRLIVCGFAILQGLYEALRVIAFVFVHFTRILRSCTGARVCFRAFCKDSTELYGCSCLFSCILLGFYGAVRVLVCVFVHFTNTLRSSTGARVCFRAF